MTPDATLNVPMFMASQHFIIGGSARRSRCKLLSLWSAQTPENAIVCAAMNEHGHVTLEASVSISDCVLVEALQLIAVGYAALFFDEGDAHVAPETWSFSHAPGGVWNFPPQWFNHKVGIAIATNSGHDPFVYRLHYSAKSQRDASYLRASLEKRSPLEPIIGQKSFEEQLTAAATHICKNETVCLMQVLLMSATHGKRLPNHLKAYKTHATMPCSNTVLHDSSQHVTLQFAFKTPSGVPMFAHTPYNARSRHARSLDAPAPRAPG